MANNSSIEWTDCTWNPLAGCKEISPGCRNCYAATMAHRLGAMAQADLAAGRDPGKKRHYIGTTEKRGGKVVWNGKVNLIHEALSEPLKWRKPRKVFVNSMSDLFHEDVPFDFVDQVFTIMLANAVLRGSTHAFQLLTKRPKRMHEYLSLRSPMEHLKCWSKLADGWIILDEADEYFSEMMSRTTAHNWNSNGHAPTGEKWAPWSHLNGLWPLPNAWLGTSCEDQKRAEDRVPWLEKCPAVVRFLSCEPLLGSIKFDHIGNSIFNREKAIRDAMNGPAVMNRDQADSIIAHPQIHWVIAGCESGHGRRRTEQAWIESLADQCRNAGVAFFNKQMEVNGKVSTVISEFPEHLRVREFPVGNLALNQQQLPL